MVRFSMAVTTVLVALALAWLHHCQAAPTLLNLVRLEAEAAGTGAVCNDGSAPGIYWKQGIAAQHNVWLIYLQGGGWCYSSETCEERFTTTPHLMGSVSWPQTLHKGGLFDDDQTKSPFAGANKVFVGYCSSDAYMGDVPASKETFGYAFRGQRIFSMIINTLIEEHNMGTNGEHATIVIGGCGTGGMGAMSLVDTVPDILESYNIHNFTLQAIFDSAFWINSKPLDPETPSLQNQTQTVLETFNATGVIDKGCRDANSAVLWKCMYPEYKIAYVETPYLLIAPQFDKLQLAYDMGGMPPYTSTAQTAYVSAFQTSMVAALADLPTPLQEDSSLIYSPACFVNCQTLDGKTYGFGFDNKTVRVATYLWYAGIPIRRLVDNCTGLNCGGCRIPKHVKAVKVPMKTVWANTDSAKENEAMNHVNKFVLVLLVMAIATCMVIRVRKSRMCDVNRKVDDIIMQTRVKNPQRPAGAGSSGYSTFGQSGRVATKAGGAGTMKMNDSSYRMDIADLSR